MFVLMILPTTGPTTPQRIAYLRFVTPAFPGGLWQGCRSCQKFATAAEAQEQIDRLVAYATSCNDAALIDHFKTIAISTTEAEKARWTRAGLARLL